MPEIKWETPEFDYHKKDISWYWLVIIIGVVIAGLALWQNNLLFAIFAAVAVTMLVVWGKEKPKRVKCALDEKDLKVDKTTYNINDFEGFAFDDDLLVLKRNRKYSPYLKIKIDGDKKKRIGDLLDRHLKKIDYNGSLTDAFAKWIRF